MSKYLSIILLGIWGMLPCAPSLSLAQTETPFAVAVPLKGIVIDGKLDDWPAGLEKHWILHHGQAYGPTDIDNADLKTSADLSPRVMFGYNPVENFLYVAVIVRDDKEVAGFGPLNTDGCEIYVEGTRKFKVVSPNTNFMAEKMAALAYDMAATGGSYDSAQMGVSDPKNPIMGGGDITRTKTRCVHTRNNDVSVYEWAVEAYDRFPDSPARLIPGRTIGIDVVVDDFDGEGNPAWVTWGPYKPLKFYNGDSLGEVLIADKPGNVGTVTGTVIARTEKTPLKKYDFGVYRGEEMLGTFRTDDDGKYSMHLLAGKYTFRPLPKQGITTETVKTVTVKSGGEIPADFSPSLFTFPDILVKSAEVYKKLAGYRDSTYITVKTKNEYGEQEEVYPYFIEIERPGKLRLGFESDTGAGIGPVSVFFVAESLAIYDKKQDAFMRVKYPGDRKYPPQLLLNSVMNLQAPQTSGNLLGLLFLFGEDPLVNLSKHTESIRVTGRDTVEGEPATIVEIVKTYDDLLQAQPEMQFSADTDTITVRLWFGNNDFLLKKVAFSPNPEKLVGGMLVKNQKIPNGMTSVTIRHTGAKANPVFAENHFIFKAPEGAAERPININPEKKITIRKKDLTGKPAIEFALKDLDGREILFSELRGNVVVLDFWAALNESSVQTLELVQTIHRQFEGKNVRVIGINEFEDESPDAFRSFLKEHGITCPILKDTEGIMVERYGFNKIPACFVIDKKGIVRKSYSEKPDGAELAGMVEKLLGE